MKVRHNNYGDLFSDGVEVIARAFMTVWHGIVLVIGGSAMVAFAILMLPLVSLGYLARKLGFESRWL